MLYVAMMLSLCNLYVNKECYTLKKVGILCSALLLTASVASADVYYANPPTVYVRPDPYAQTGEAIGNILGAIIGNANQASEEKALQEAKENALKAIQERANAELDSMIYSTNTYGINGTINNLQDAAFRQGIKLDVRQYNDIIELSYQEKHDGYTACFNYAYNTSLSECRVVIEIPEFSIRKFAYGKYSEPQPQQTQQPAPADLTQAVGQYLGIVTSIEKTPEGGFTILEVFPNGLSDFAGVKAGDILTKIDTYDLKEHDIDRVAAYIALRYRQKQVIRATVLRDGKPKVIQIQL